MSDTDRARVWRGLMRAWSAQHETVPNNLKADIRAAVDAMDTFLNDNASTVNNALPTAFKNNATNAQKAMLLACVALARYDVEALRRLLGEID